QDNVPGTTPVSTLWHQGQDGELRRDLGTPAHQRPQSRGTHPRSLWRRRQWPEAALMRDAGNRWSAGHADQNGGNRRDRYGTPDSSRWAGLGLGATVGRWGTDGLNAVRHAGA